MKNVHFPGKNSAAVSEGLRDAKIRTSDDRQGIGKSGVAGRQYLRHFTA